MAKAEDMSGIQSDGGPVPPPLPMLSLTDGGPAYALFCRLKLVYSGRRKDAIRIAIILALATWAPLVILSLSEGLAFGGTRIPLLYDFGPHVRFLFALPILVLAEIPVGLRVGGAVARFWISGVMAREDEGRFVEIIEDTIRFRDSRTATVLLVLITAAFEWRAFAMEAQVGVGTWVRPVIGDHFSGAGYWYSGVAIPLYQFLILRWGYRIVVWGRFLGAIARMNLRLMPTHPDGAGGIGFLGRTIVPFGAIGMAASAVLSATIAPRVLFAGENIYAELPAYVVLVVLLLIIAIGPLLLFTPRLYVLKQDGLETYGTLATAYTQKFDAKWIAHRTPPAEPLLGTADIQSLADLGNSFHIIEDMRLLPVAREHLIAFVVPILTPALFLVLAVVPLNKILDTLMRIFA
jgi:hypothetical protein